MMKSGKCTEMKPMETLRGAITIKDTTTGLKRMELANTFFITVPGPKMIWQFGEVGYDIPIDFMDEQEISPLNGIIIRFQEKTSLRFG